MIFSLFFPQNRIWHYMQIVSFKLFMNEDNLHEMSNPVFWEKQILPRVLSVISFINLRGTDTLSGKTTLPKLFFSPFGSKFFPFRVDAFFFLKWD